MTILLYCVAEADTLLAQPLSGVRDTAVESLEESGVRCFYSRINDVTATNSEAFREDALRFHAVIHNILVRAAVVPFRFPTLLERDGEVREYLQPRASTYLEDLRRLRGLVQMEVRIRSRAVATDANSGTAYMRARQAETHALAGHAAAAYSVAAEFIEQWRVQSESSGVRCYALVRREQVATFEERMRSLSPLEGATMIVSGPWPPTEFLHVPTS